VFFQVQSLEELLVLKENHPEGRFLAGGTDLMVELHRTGETPAIIFDISQIPQLHGITEQNNRIFIGAAATFSEIESSAFLKKKAPLLCRAAAEIGSPQIRNLGTIGGNVANASPAADTLPVLAWLNADVHLLSCSGKQRQISVTDFITGAGQTILAPDELITSISFAPPDEFWQCSYRKIGRRNALAISRLSGACGVRCREDGLMEEIRLSLGAVFPSPRRLLKTEAFLTGKYPDALLLKTAGEIAVEEIVAVSGRRASASYKMEVVCDVVASLVTLAINGEEV